MGAPGRIITVALCACGGVSTSTGQDAGADVAICARKPESLESAAAALKATGLRISARPCDLAKETEVRSWVEAAAQDLGGIDISPIVLLLLIFFARSFLRTTIAPALI